MSLIFFVFGPSIERKVLRYRLYPFRFRYILYPINAAAHTKAIMTAYIIIVIIDVDDEGDGEGAFNASFIASPSAFTASVGDIFAGGLVSQV